MSTAIVAIDPHGITREQRANQLKFADALDSGAWEQVQRTYFIPNSNKACAAGVGIKTVCPGDMYDLTRRLGWHESNNEIKLPSRDGQATTGMGLPHLNDDVRLTFPQIADLVRARIFREAWE